jgi:replicative DNA helicase
MRPDIELDRGLPESRQAEQFVLASVLIDGERFSEIAGELHADLFSLNAHRLIFARLVDLAERGEKIGRVEIAEELMRHKELESAGGLSGLLSMEEGMPHVRDLSSYIKIIKDKASLRRIIHTSEHIRNRALLAQESPDEILAGAGEAFMGIGEGRQKAGGGLVSAGEYLRGFPGGLQSFVQPHTRENGRQIGFAKFDEMTGGLRSGELMLLAARPGAGKSAFSLNMAWNVASRYNEPVAVFALEMSTESLMLRLLCSVARIDSHRLRAGYLNQQEIAKLREAANRIVDTPLYVDDSSNLTVMDFHAKVRQCQQKNKIKFCLAVIDYLQLMAGKGESRNQEVSKISRGLKMLTGSDQLDMAIVALSQVSRESEKRTGDMRPRLIDLKESGCLAGASLVTVASSGARLEISSTLNMGPLPVLTSGKDTLKQECGIAVRAFSTGMKPTFRLTTQLGRSIVATANQKFMGFQGWLRLDEITTGTRIGVPRVTRACSQSQTMSDDELMLLGHLIGNGCTLPRHIVQYTTPHPELADMVAACASRMFGDRISPRISRERTWIQVYLSASFRLARGRMTPVRAWLEPMGLFGLRAPDKKMPEAIFMQPVTAIAKFLAHLWSTDGCISFDDGPNVYYSTSSQKLACQIQSALLRLSINARTVPVPQKKGLVNYHVTLSGKPDMTRFANSIGAMSERHKRQLELIVEHLDMIEHNTNRDIIPASMWTEVDAAMRSKGLDSRQLAELSGCSYSGVSTHHQNMSRERAAKFASASGCERLGKLAASDIYWDEVVSVEPSGVQETFDLTVPGNENYVANDIYVHNSLEQDADLVAFIFREEMYKKDREDLRGLAELILAKQRNGSVGTIDLAWMAAMQKFESRAEDLGDIPPEQQEWQHAD